MGAGEVERLVTFAIKLSVPVEGFAWTQYGSTDAWFCSFTRGEVVALGEGGDEYEQAADAADCSSRAGSWYFDYDNQVLYVRLSDDGEPGALASGGESEYSIDAWVWKGFCNTREGEAGAMERVDYAPEDAAHAIQFLPLIDMDAMPEVTQGVGDYYVGSVQMQFGDAALVNDGSLYGMLDDYEWTNAEIVIRVGEFGDDYDDLEVVFWGRIQDPEVDDERLTMALTDLRMTRIGAVPRYHFWKTDYPNLEDNAEGVIIPVPIGQVFNMPVVCVDTTTFRYKPSRVALQSIDAVYKAAVALTPVVDYTTDEASGEFTLLADPAGAAITCDVHGALIDMRAEQVEDGGMEDWTAAGYSTDQIPDMTANTAPSGTASASNEVDAGHQAWKAMNDSNVDIDDSWRTADVGPTWWLKYQFPTAIVATRYTITSRNTDPDTKRPAAWKFQGSNDDAAWTDLDTQAGQVFGQNEKKTYSFTNSTAYAYYRLLISAVSGGGASVAIGEFEIMVSTPETLTYWTAVVAGTSTVTKESAGQHAGSFAAKITIDAGNSAGSIYQDLALEADADHELSLWYKNSGVGKTAVLQIRDSGSNVYLNASGEWQAGACSIPLTNSVAWAEFTLTFKTHASYTAYRIYIGNPGGLGTMGSSSVLIDDVALLGPWGYAENISDAFRFILQNENEIPSSKLKLSDFAALKAARTQKIGLLLNEQKDSTEWFRILQTSGVCHFMPLLDGTFSVKFYAAGVPVGTKTLRTGTYHQIKIKKQSGTVFSEVVVKYKKYQANGTWLEKTATNPNVSQRYGTHESLILETALVDGDEAQNLADFFAALVAQPARKVTLETSHTGMDGIPSDKIILEKEIETSEGETITVLDTELHRILELVKRIGPMTVQMTTIPDAQSLGDLLCQNCFACQLCFDAQGGACTNCYACELCDVGQCSACMSCVVSTVCPGCECEECASCQHCDSCTTPCYTGQCTACEHCFSGQCAACMICDNCEFCVDCELCFAVNP